MRGLIPTRPGIKLPMAEFKKDEPQYLVRGEKSGGTAVHEPDVLERARQV
jgi:hypothetical protein